MSGPEKIRVEDVPPETLARVVEVMTPYLTEPRRARIDAVLAQRTRDVVLVLEDIANEHNSAAVLRSADAFGLCEVHFIDPGYRSLVASGRVTSGAHRWLDLKRHKHPKDAYAHLAARGFQIWAADIHGPTVPLGEIDVRQKVAVVFGNEHAGLSDAAASAAHGRFRVPMTGFVESLNVSVAAAVTAYDLTARRDRLGLPRGLDASDALRLRAAWYARSVRACTQILAREGLPLPVLLPEAVIQVLEDGPPDE